MEEKLLQVEYHWLALFLISQDVSNVARKAICQENALTLVQEEEEEEEEVAVEAEVMYLIIFHS